ncbi:SCO4402 family protein [Budvicia aquatica]|uniref:Uncharacterized protein n=2 Tax=Budvicia aquatica TaxID=82979 RepID=A0A484ZJB6_9GAMM|nr:hypothetical protein [Budvicia aquatica]VFS48572.1 Uncharacterised protein [Budvicia aquatica]
MKKLEINELKYPWMRDELIIYLHGLSDEKYQSKAWIEDDHPNGGHDELDYTIHFLYDDTDLANDPLSLIGWILRDTIEANAIAALIDKLNILFEMYGTDLSDKEYLAKTEWKDVVKAAKLAEMALRT